MNSERNTYTLSSTAWPRDVWARSETQTEDLMVDLPEGECAIRWHDLGGKGAAELVVFDDSWAHLGWLAELLAGEVGDAQPAMVVAELERRGYVPSEFHGRLVRPLVR